MLRLKDFIHGPYIKCPKCGKNSFSVSIICDHHYFRRCTECFYPDPSKGEKGVKYPLPKLNKKVIYIDQFAISNMMKFLNPSAKSHKKVKGDIFWGKLFRQLHTLCKLQLIICPDSDMHEAESLLAPYYKPLKRIYELFSHSISFKSHETIKLFQIIGQFNIWIGETKRYDLNVQDILSKNINAWQDRLIISVNRDNPQSLIEEIRTNRDKVDGYIRDIFEKWQKEESKDFNFWYKKERKSIAKALIKRYQKDLARRLKMFYGLIPFELDAFSPSFATKTIYAIKKRLKCQGISGENDINKKLSEFLYSETFEDAPYIKIASMLYAEMARRVIDHGRKKPPGRGFLNDVEMISTLLPYCDAMFIDNECRRLLLEKPLCEEIDYGTKIYSLSNKKEFLEYLDEIRQSASEEHIKAVEEVYGSNWAKPYWGIFKQKL
jgi:hypothetical protein